MQIIKRDGRITEFNEERIIKAITLAMSHTSGGVDIELATKIADSIRNQVKDKVQVSVYEIQDLVEKKLMGSSRKEVAQEYITYRYNRDVARKSKSKDIFIEIIETKTNNISYENTNTSSNTPAGMMMKFASETTKPFVEDFLLSSEARKALRQGYIYVHDEAFYPTKSLTCIQHPLDKILKNGIKIGHGISRPAKKIETASIIGCILLETVQNEMHGEQSIPAFDYYLAPYVRFTYKEEIKKLEEIINKDLSNLYDYDIKDYIKSETKDLQGDDKYIQIAINYTVDRVHYAMEAFIHNMNTIHSRGGNQVVQSAINYGTDDSPEGRCIIREILLATENGVGNGETPLFPIQIWKKKTGINYNPKDRNYDLYRFACKVAAKRCLPRFLNLDTNYNMNENWNEKDLKRYYYELAVMGSSIRVFENRHGKNTSIGRGNLSTTTINLVRIAIESAKEAQINLGMSFELGINSDKFMNNKYNKEVKKVFLNKLEEYTDIVARQLYDRYKFQCTAVTKQFPILMSGLWQDSENLNQRDKVEDVLKHGTLSIGFIGLAECLIILTGKHHAESDNTQEIGIEIITQLKELIDKYSERYDLNYTLLGTPIEAYAERFITMDIKEFGIIQGVTDKDYYTESNHIPKDYKCTLEEKAKIESPYHKITNAGHIFYEKIDRNTFYNQENVERLIDLMDKYEIGYVSIYKEE